MENIAEILEGVKTMGIGGHIRPDGDCVGSCMALYLYVKTYYPEIQADVYLDNPKPVFGHIDCMDEIKTELDGDKEYRQRSMTERKSCTVISEKCYSPTLE